MTSERIVPAPTRVRAIVWVMLGQVACCLGACQALPDVPEREQPELAPISMPAPGGYGHWADPFAALPRATDQLASTCAHSGSDLVRDIFRWAQPAPIASLHDLELAVGIDPAAIGGFTGIAVTGHSTSLSTRSVSAINPRAILLRLELPPAVELVMMSFSRGEQFSELVARDRVDHELRFYLVRFEQACNSAPGGCVPGDLLTPAVESDWQNVGLYDEASLANTVLDCTTCHQPNGPGTPKLVRMPEFADPWTHWFFRGTDGGAALIDDYVAARGDEPVLGVPRSKIESTTPGNLSTLAVNSASPAQPNEFDSKVIENEVRASAAASGGNQPTDNSVPGISPTWRATYDRAQRGEAIPVPYHDVKISDAAKLARMTEAYRSYRSGELPQAELPDIRDVFPDDPQRLAEMGMTTEPGLSGEAVLLQACSQCHNERLDQDLHRARFRADLQGLERAEKDLAIARLLLPETHPLAMPPARLRVLSEELGCARSRRYVVERCSLHGLAVQRVADTCASRLVGSLLKLCNQKTDASSERAQKRRAQGSARVVHCAAAGGLPVKDPNPIYATHRNRDRSDHRSCGSELHGDPVPSLLGHRRIIVQERERLYSFYHPSEHALIDGMLREHGIRRLHHEYRADTRQGHEGIEHAFLDLLLDKAESREPARMAG